MNEEKKYEVLRTVHGAYATRLTEKYKTRKKWEPSDPRKVFSSIPGTVVSVEAKPGQSVRKGDVLVVYTAMKMTNTLKSPLDGKIRSVGVAPGDPIPKGHLMIEFE